MTEDHDFGFLYRFSFFIYLNTTCDIFSSFRKADETHFLFIIQDRLFLKMGNLTGLKLVAFLSLLFSVQAFTKSCCSLSEEELTDIRGTHEECPDLFSFSGLNEKCVDCPKGTCRTGRDCVCPGEFLSSQSFQLECENSFGQAWPATVGEEDPDFKECTQPEEDKPDPSNISCCSMTEEQLTQLRGWHPDCPTSSIIGSSLSTLDEKCSVCPAGSCRVNNDCRCPDQFLSLYASDCSDSFTVSWPESVGREDVDIRSCKLNSTSTTSSTSGSDTSKDSSNEKDKNEKGGSNGDTTVINTTNEDSSGGAGGSSQVNVETGNSSNENAKDDGGLSTLEIVGIVAGIVGSIVAVITLVIGLRHRKKKRKNMELEMDEESMPENIE